MLLFFHLQTLSNSVYSHPRSPPRLPASPSHALWWSEYEYFFCFPHLSWSPPLSLSISFLSLMSIWTHVFLLLSRLLPPSLPAASVQPVGNFHTRLIEFAPSHLHHPLFPFSLRRWEETTPSHRHTHLKASMCKWTLNNETHFMVKLRSSRHTNTYGRMWRWSKGHKEYEQAPEETRMLMHM